MDPRVVYVCYEPRFSLTALIREIAFQMAGVRPRMAQAAVDVIQDELARQRRLILVDEADQMSIKYLNQLRAFHDLHQLAVVLLGEDTLHPKLAREGRLISRVRMELRFRPVAQMDVAVFYRKALDVKLEPSQTERLLRHSGGDFRRLMVDALHMERIMRASGISEVSDLMVGEVCN